MEDRYTRLDERRIGARRVLELGLHFRRGLALLLCMASIEITIANQKYVVRGEDTEEHLKEIAELVRRKVESLRKKTPSLTVQKAAMLAAFDFASDSIKGKLKAQDHRSSVLAKATELLHRVEGELASKPPSA